jgi:hypothetical protein
MAVPARFDGGFAFTSAQQAVDEASQKKKPAIPNGPASFR